MTQEELRGRLRAVYVDGCHDLDLTERIEDTVEQLRQRASILFGRPASIHNIPQEVNYYYTIECCLTDGCPEYYNELVLVSDAQSFGTVEYFQLMCSVVVPITAGIWHRFQPASDQTFDHSFFDLFSDEWLSDHADHRTMALQLDAAAEQLRMSMLGWDMLLEPADADWPKLQHAPEQAELRHYIFPGFYEDWGE